VCFWNHRPERLWPEGYGFSLLDDSGPSTPRAEEAGRIARGIQKYAGLFQNGSAPRAPVAILINEDLWHFVEGSGLRGHLAYSLRGIYRVLWEHAIPVDFLDVRDLGRLAPHYKALVMPLPLALDGSLIEALRAWVRQGGTLISEAAPGRFDRYGMGHRGRMAPGVSELFGVTERELRLIREPNDGAKWTGVQRTFDDTVPYRELSGAGEWSSHRVSPAFYLQSLNCTTAKPLLSDENGVYGAENSFGSGKACLIGTLLGHATQAFSDPRNGNFLAALLSKAGVVPEKIGSLHVRRRVLGKQTAWFLFNITDSEVEESLPVPAGATVSDLLGEPTPRVDAAIKVRVPALDVRCLVQS
jgi:beta-galactosidase